MQIISNKTASIKNMIGNALRAAKEDGLLAAFGGMLAGTVGIGATMALQMLISMSTTKSESFLLMLVKLLTDYSKIIKLRILRQKQKCLM